MADALLGKMVGEYQVTARLGPGETGGSYRVRHRFLKIDRALQVVQPAPGVVVGVVLEEARLLASIRHKNLVRIHDRGELDDSTLFFLTELLKGESLRRTIQRAGPLPVRDALKILRDISGGLGEAHALGVVHRNIRPEGLFLAREGGVNVAKLVDFGLGLPREHDAVMAMVNQGVFPGGATYAAPEQLGKLKAGDAIDSRADVYSLGLCLYEALTGEPAFQSNSPNGALDERLRNPPPLASSRAPAAGIEPELDQLLEAMLEVDCAKRPRDAREIASSLDRFLLEVRRPKRPAEVVQAAVAMPTPMASRRVSTVRPVSSDAGEDAEIRTQVGESSPVELREESVAAAPPPAAKRGRATRRPVAPPPAPTPIKGKVVKAGLHAVTPALKPEPSPPSVSERSAAKIAEVTAKSRPTAVSAEPPQARRPEAPVASDSDNVARGPIEVELPRVRSKEHLDRPISHVTPDSDARAIEGRIGGWNPIPTPSAERDPITKNPIFIAGGVGVVALIVIIALVAGLKGSSKTAVAPLLTGVDSQQLDLALQAGDRASLRSWLRTFPESPHREKAYLALAKNGMTTAEVCDHARLNSAALVSGGGELAKLCK